MSPIERNGTIYDIIIAGSTIFYEFVYYTIIVLTVYSEATAACVAAGPIAEVDPSSKILRNFQETTFSAPTFFHLGSGSVTPPVMYQMKCG